MLDYFIKYIDDAIFKAERGFLYLVSYLTLKKIEKITWILL